MVSSPGKVILFGEHSVVYGEPAIAASVALKTYLHVSPSEEKVTLLFPDTKLEMSWNISDLPFAKTPEEVPTELDPTVLKNLEPCLANIEDTFQHAAALAFLYLYVHLMSPECGGFVFAARSVLPIGAGLGSSASMSVCMAGAMLHLRGQASLEDINSWAFIGEKCIQGNPSGIDNNVAARGGAVMFKKAVKPGDKAVLRPLALRPLNLLLTNTRVPRRSKELVANVGELVKARPAIAKPILESMGHLVTEAEQALADGDTSVLQDLVRLNHGLLVSLGVSHTSLEKIRIASQDLDLGETKLTGAGGGGCGITLVKTGVEETSVSSFRSALPDYEVFETVLGGPGVGVASVATSSAQFLDQFDSTSLDNLNWTYWSS